MRSNESSYSGLPGNDYCCNYHLGFDHVNRVCKLLKISCLNYGCEFETLILGVDTVWRKLDVRAMCRNDEFWRLFYGNPPVTFMRQSFSVNGVLYWKHFITSLRCMWTLISFDLSKEVFQLVFPPCPSDLVPPDKYRFAQFNGCLALSTFPDDSKCILIYSLGDHEGNAWTKHTTPLPREVIIAGKAGQPVPIANLPTCEILLANRRSRKAVDKSLIVVYSYDNRDDKFERFVVGELPHSLDLLDIHYAASICCLEENFMPLDDLFGGGGEGIKS